MGLFDSYFDPDQFQASGGLLGRLLSLQPQDQFQPGAGFDPQNAAGDPTASASQTPVSLPIASPTSSSAAPSLPQTPDDGQTQNIAIGDYQMPQFGRADVPVAPPPPPDLGDRLSAGLQSWAQTPVGNPFAALANGIAGFNAGQRTDAAGLVPAQTPSPISAQSPDLGDRLSAGFQSWAHTPVGNPFAALANGITGFNAGQRTGSGGIAPQNLQPSASDPANASQDLNARYEALRSFLGDRNAMLAIVHPEVGQKLIAQALAGQTTAGNSGDVEVANGNQSSIANQTNLAGNGQLSGSPGPAKGTTVRANNSTALLRKRRGNFGA